MLVVLTAVAGAVHFHAEKRGFEAEGFAYRDALDKFTRAERAFARLVDPVGGVPVGQNDMAAQTLVRELGLLALRENETWLKTHRERPLSPVVGWSYCVIKPPYGSTIHVYESRFSLVKAGCGSRIQIGRPSGAVRRLR